MLPVLALLASSAVDPAYGTFDAAYASLRAREFDEAAALFRAGLAISPHRVDVRKDLAYTLLKMGDTIAARDHFAEVVRRSPSDFFTWLEYAFLAYETGRKREARLVFQRVAGTGDAASRATAAKAFRDIDVPLAEGIARWSRAAAQDASNFSAHQELARLAEERNDFALAARHLEAAWRLKPAERVTLLDLGRAYKELGQQERSIAALVAASRGAQPRIAEAARALLPDRYPYVYEFRLAVELDPANTGLRRELAYLLLEMNLPREAESEFEKIAGGQPDDLLSQAQLGFLKLRRRDRSAALPHLQHVLDADAGDDLTDRVLMALERPRRLRQRPDTPRRDLLAEARRMAEKSYEAGYLQDALRYLNIAHEHDPLDFGVILRLGQTNNLLHNDREALDWFSVARKASDPELRKEADRAWRNLRHQYSRVRASFWAFPFYSMRWGDAFSYAQGKLELNSALPVRPYLSVRFIGDLRGSVKQPVSAYLSETAIIPGIGLATKSYRGALVWGEAGAAISYLRRHDQASRVRPDYRAGLSYTHARRAGRGFLETNDDLLYVSRFGNTALLYSQNRLGRTLADDLRVYWNFHLTADAKSQYWANTAETGPGVRWKAFSVDMVRGAHLTNAGNPRRPNYTDVRAGMWYAFRR